MKYNILFFVLFLSCNVKVGHKTLVIRSSNLSKLNFLTHELDTIYFPKGTYYLNQIVLGDNKFLKTDGYKTKIFQNPQDSIRPAILIEGSNVTIEPITINGNISKEKGEWNHAIAIIANGKTISNIQIQGLRANDIRGDGVYVGSSIYGGIPSNVSITNINVNNCFRNGISVVSGKNISIRNIHVQKSGLFGLDIECNPGILSVNDVNISKYEGGSIGIIGNKSLVRNIHLKNILVDGQLLGSSPKYPIESKDGLVFRQCSNVFFDSVSISNCGGWGINSYKSIDEVLIDSIFISNVFFKNVGFNNSDYNAIVNLMAFKKLNINGLETQLKDNQSLFLGNDKPQNLSQSVELKNAKVSGGYLARYCTVNGDNLNLSNMKAVSERLHANSSIKNSRIDCLNFDNGSKSLQVMNSSISYSNSFCDNCNKELLKTNTIKKTN